MLDKFDNFFSLCLFVKSYESSFRNSKKAFTQSFVNVVKKEKWVYHTHHSIVADLKKFGNFRFHKRGFQNYSWKIKVSLKLISSRQKFVNSSRFLICQIWINLHKRFFRSEKWIIKSILFEFFTHVWGKKIIGRMKLRPLFIRHWYFLLLSILMRM